MLINERLINLLWVSPLEFIQCNDKTNNLNFKEINRLLIEQTTIELPPRLDIEMVIMCTLTNLN